MESGLLFQDPQEPGQYGDFCRIDNLPLDYSSIWLSGNQQNFLNATKGVMQYSLPRLLLQLALIFLLTQSLHNYFKRFDMPRIISEIMAGLILGPTILGRMIPSLTAALFSDDRVSLIEILSKIGFTFFMFLVGVKMDPMMIHKSGHKSLAIGAVLVLFPATVGYSFATVFQMRLPAYRRPPFAAILSAQFVIPFPVIATLLVDLKIMNSELGRLVLASGLVSSLLSSFLNNLLQIFRLKTTALDLVYELCILSLALMICTFVVARPLSSYIIKNTSEGKPVKPVYVNIIASVVLVWSIFSDNVGLQYHFGPFLLGLVVPDGPPLGSTLVEKWETLVSGLLAPLTVTYCALKVDLLMLYDLAFVSLLWVIIFGMFLLKFITTLTLAVLCKVSVRDSLALSLIMNIQGVVEIAMYNDIYKNQILDGDSLGAVVLSVLIIAPSVTLIVKHIHDNELVFTYRGYERRSLVHTAYNSELRLLVCAHRQDDAVAAIKLLEFSTPTKVSPITAYALNLAELVGRATPLLINHSLGQKSSIQRSQQMIESFQELEQKFPGVMTTQSFTAISLPRFMHHDICWLAFNKLVALVILPFHRKWNHMGQVIFDSSIQRTINEKVMDSAPCSVAILVDRRKIRQDRSPNSDSLYHVGVVFLGGDDDREALAYGKRMAMAPGVELSVVRLVGEDGVGQGKWDVMLDLEALKDVKAQSSQKSNVVYREETVKDGPATVMILNAMEEAFDLILAGKRHEADSPLLSDLMEWSELPELGTVGDILASSDVKRPVSVLVVQQQILRGKS